MARIARVVVPGIPHHITQRGNHRMDTFFSEKDYPEYLSMMAEWCNRCKVQIWTYCLMPNHVHLIAAARYVELNPVKARMVKKPDEYRWSSAKAHLQGQDDMLVKSGPLLAIGKVCWQAMRQAKREKSSVVTKKVAGPLVATTFS